MLYFIDSYKGPEMRFYRTQTDNNGNGGTCSLKRIENTNNRWIDITLFSLFSVDPGDELVFGVR